MTIQTDGLVGKDPGSSSTAVGWAKADNIADSGTPAIGLATGSVVDLDGTTTITAFDTIAAGAVRFVTFTGIRTITYNATSMILPGNRSILTAAGDRATFISLGSGNWRCHEYLKASGLAIGNTDETTVITSATITTQQSYGGQINNYNQSADCKLTLLACAKGMNFTVCLSTTVAKYYQIEPAAGEIITLDGVALTADQHVGVASAAVSQEIQFKAIQTGASTYAWDAKVVLGPWAGI